MACAPETMRNRYRAVRRSIKGGLSASLERSRNIETRQVVKLSTLGVDAPHRMGYEPSRWNDLRRVLRRGDVAPGDVFLDLGSGMGRLVLLAARYPFARVIGVEISDHLNAIAQRNVAADRWRRRCRDIELVKADVTDYQIPDDVSIVYIFNSFSGPVFDGVIEGLIASADRHPRRIRLIYRNAVEHDRLMSTGRFRLVRAISHRQTPKQATSYIRLYELEPAQAA